MNSSYTDAEYKLVSDIMDYVDRLRESDLATPDVPKVVALVKKTYQDQGIDVKPELLSRAVTMAMSAFPAKSTALAPIVIPAASKLIGFAGHPIEIKESPVDKANRLIRRLQSHNLFTQKDLATMLAKRRQAWTHEKEGVLRKRVKWMAAAGLSGAVLWPAAFFMSSGTMLPVPLMVVVPFMAIVGTVAHFFNVRSDYLKKGFERLSYAEADLANHELNSYWLREFCQEELEAAHYDCLPMEDLANWEFPNSVAASDPLLAATWERWLKQDAPIRNGDVSLLCRARDAIRDAKKWLAFRQNIEFPALTQAEVRTQALAHMRELAGQAPLLPAPEVVG